MSYETYMLFVTITVSFWSGVLASWWFTRNSWRDDMIRRGHARYHWMNGKWYWNEDEPKESLAAKDQRITEVYQVGRIPKDKL